MHELHFSFGAVLIVLTVACLPVYVRIIYLFISLAKYRDLQCYRVMAQQGIAHCLMAPYFISLGIGHFLGGDFHHVGQTSLKLMGACLRSEAIFGFVLALDRLQLLCDLSYPNLVHTLICIFSWLFGLTYFTMLMTPGADFILDIASYSSYFDTSKPYSIYVQEAGYCVVLVCSCLTFAVYSILVIYLIWRRHKQHVHGNYFQEKVIFIQAVIRFVSDACLTVLYNFGSSFFGPSFPLRMVTTICYILNYLFLPPLLYLLLISSIRERLIPRKGNVDGSLVFARGMRSHSRVSSILPPL
uniref:7TM_GPCR_Srx domain-containing protein n=1 Tax=Steinernema glaseri TaxID=37863 RepID=A0A1I7ZQ19_9BILA